MKLDIYLNHAYSPLFQEDSKGIWSIAMVHNQTKVQALRNRVRARINAFFIDSINQSRKITEQDRFVFLNLVATEAQVLGIDLTGDDLNRIKFEVVNKSIQITLDL